jgi:hypothetical protein
MVKRPGWWRKTSSAATADDLDPAPCCGTYDLRLLPLLDIEPAVLPQPREPATSDGEAVYLQPPAFLADVTPWPSIVLKYFRAAFPIFSIRGSRSKCDLE